MAYIKLILHKISTEINFIGEKPENSDQTFKLEYKYTLLYRYTVLEYIELSSIYIIIKNYQVQSFII